MRPADDAPLTLRLMTEEDIPLLHGWLQRPHIVRWWGGEAGRPKSLAETRANYLPRVLGSRSDGPLPSFLTPSGGGARSCGPGDRVTPYIAMLGDRPIGYAQSYVAIGSGDGWWEEITDPGVRGIDQSLGHEADLGQGLGTRLVTALCELLFQDPQVTRIQTDPDPTNARAIRCYEKAGFRALREIVTPDGPALYMVRDRA
jgi:RimJ/RimL family protein N-acetyltransferase